MFSSCQHTFMIIRLYRYAHLFNNQFHVYTDVIGTQNRISTFFQRFPTLKSIFVPVYTLNDKKNRRQVRDLQSLAIDLKQWGMQPCLYAKIVNLACTHGPGDFPTHANRLQNRRNIWIMTNHIDFSACSSMSYTVGLSNL